jgi:hypothetical protein
MGLRQIFPVQTKRTVFIKNIYLKLGPETEIVNPKAFVAGAEPVRNGFAV